MEERSCSIEDCKNRAAKGRQGWCNTHRSRWYRHGTTDGAPIVHRTLYERMDDKTQRGETEADCWVWIGGRSKAGYGGISVAGGRMLLAHRVSYERHVGPIPEGLHIDHLCRNRACINPRHLEPVTKKVNSLRGISIPAINARLTHCRRGHPFDEANTRWDRHGHRACIACINARRRKTAA